MNSGRCRAIAPEVFGADAEGWVALKDPNPDERWLDAVAEAAQACPTGSIEIDEEG